MTSRNQHDSARHETVDPWLPRSNEPTGKSPASSDGYEIRVQGHLETYWFEWFGGWSITNLENGEALLRGAGVDQSALHGALNKIRNLNLTLVSVTRISKETTHE
jgi:hypothetical protein